MIDDDDPFFVAMLWPSGGSGGVGCFVALLGLAVVVALCIMASQNRATCAELACPHGGHAVLMKHECLCVETPVKP
jgi:hypothetical protein